MKRKVSYCFIDLKDLPKEIPFVIYDKKIIFYNKEFISTQNILDYLKYKEANTSTN